MTLIQTLEKLNFKVQVGLENTLFEATTFERVNDMFECVLGFHIFIASGRLNDVVIRCLKSSLKT